ncbi:unnamed protein product, partial [Musa textilis]
FGIRGRATAQDPEIRGSSHCSRPRRPRVVISKTVRIRAVAGIEESLTCGASHLPR